MANTITHKFNGTKVTYAGIVDGSAVTNDVIVEGSLNGGRALAAAKRATGNKNILLVSVEHITRTYEIDYEVFMSNAREVKTSEKAE